MPTYEYRCANGHRFERFQRMSEPPVDVCPECGASAERLLSAGAGLLFKGSGFYITDYRSDSYKKSAAAESGGDKSESSKSESSKSEGSKSDKSKSDSSKSGGSSTDKGSGPSSSSSGKGSDG
jgi:putative FmdB family regulatory protein